MNNKTKLSPEALAAKREYNRQWRRLHPESIKKYQKRYWEKVAEKLKQPEPET